MWKLGRVVKGGARVDFVRYGEYVGVFERGNYVLGVVGISVHGGGRASIVQFAGTWCLFSVFFLVHVGRCDFFAVKGGVAVSVAAFGSFGLHRGVGSGRLGVVSGFVECLLWCWWGLLYYGRVRSSV